MVRVRLTVDLLAWSYLKCGTGTANGIHPQISFLNLSSRLLQLLLWASWANAVAMAQSVPKKPLVATEGRLAKQYCRIWNAHSHLYLYFFDLPKMVLQWPKYDSFIDMIDIWPGIFIKAWSFHRCLCSRLWFDELIQFVILVSASGAILRQSWRSFSRLI